MKKSTKLLLGLLGLSTMGVMTYYIISSNENPTLKVKEKPIKNPNKEVVATANVIEDTALIKSVMSDAVLVKISKTLGVEGEEFKATEQEGVYTNDAQDKLLVLQEDIWKKLIKKVQTDFPEKAASCKREDTLSTLSNYKFIGLLMYFTDSKKNKKTTAYAATEVRSGFANSFAGGAICCNCGGEPLIRQQVDAVIVK